MRERFLFLPVAFALALLVIPFHLSYIALAIIVAIAILLFDLLRGKENYDPQDGYWFLAIGVILLVSAYFVSSNYGISFEALDHDQSFPKLVRRLPYFGVASLTIGAIIVAKSLFIRR
jgi:hypothetical protein